jgi:hypothetical protein
MPAINLEFSRYSSSARGCSGHLLWSGEKALPMFELLLLRTVLRTLSVVLGGFGVFYLIVSWSAPALWGLALVLIGAASGIAYFLDR